MSSRDRGLIIIIQNGKNFNNNLYLLVSWFIQSQPRRTFWKKSLICKNLKIILKKPCINSNKWANYWNLRITYETRNNLKRSSKQFKDSKRISKKLRNNPQKSPKILQNRPRTGRSSKLFLKRNRKIIANNFKVDRIVKHIKKKMQMKNETKKKVIDVRKWPKHSPLMETEVKRAGSKSNLIRPQLKPGLLNRFVISDPWRISLAINRHKYNGIEFLPVQHFCFRRQNSVFLQDSGKKKRILKRAFVTW